MKEGKKSPKSCSGTKQVQSLPVINEINGTLSRNKRERWLKKWREMTGGKEREEKVHIVLGTIKN